MKLMIFLSMFSFSSVFASIDSLPPFINTCGNDVIVVADEFTNYVPTFHGAYIDPVTFESNSPHATMTYNVREYTEQHAVVTWSITLNGVTNSCRHDAYLHEGPYVLRKPSNYRGYVDEYRGNVAGKKVVLEWEKLRIGHTENESLGLYFMIDGKQYDSIRDLPEWFPVGTTVIDIISYDKKERFFYSKVVVDIIENIRA